MVRFGEKGGAMLRLFIYEYFSKSKIQIQANSTIIQTRNGAENIVTA